eukprot:GGOE01003756.1.p1 GENE.GGOE01003756.1~~GGOE01003756.1.p1  ORF type:complete len:1245 (+),score=345.28 GGOE01003756.1:65-3799(+)
MIFNFSVFSEKIKDEDPDIRQMALYDLLTELQKENFFLDEGNQKLVVPAVLDRLDDTSTEVQGIAVKCLSPLVRKIKEVQVEKLVTTLSSKCLHEVKKEKRDIASTAMKTMVAEIPVDYSNAIRKLTSPLVLGLDKINDDQVKLEVLDVLNDVLKRFGAVVSDDHERLQAILLSELNSKSASRRKKAIVCLASLCIFSTDTLFNTVVRTLLDGIENHSGEELRKYIQCCSAVSRTAGQRLGKCLERIVPLLVKHIKATTTVESDEEDEVRENILQAFESFVVRCPGQVAQFFPDIMAVCKDLLRWDPNYDYEECDEMEEDTEEDGEEDLMDDEELDQDEEDGVSWKVRKASAKCLSAIITSRPDMLETIYQSICCQADSTLPDRFKEREESVKLDIFKTFERLLQATKVIHSSQKDEKHSFMISGTFRIHVEQKPEVRYLMEVKDKIVKGISKCLREKSVKIKIGCFILLQELALLLGKELNSDVKAFVGAIRDALTDKSGNSTLKTEALIFLRLLLVTNDNADAFKPHLGTLLPPLFQCVNDRYYKIIAEALRVCGELITVVGRLPEDEGKKKTKELFDCVFSRLSTQDVDQDVKESAIVTVGKILKESGRRLSGEDSHKSQTLLLSLLKNEMSRIITIKTLSVIRKVDVEVTTLNAVLAELAGFLRKSNRPLRQASLTTLKDLVVSQGTKIDPAHYTKMMEELAPLLSDQDLHLSYLALGLCTAILSNHPNAAQQVESLVLGKVMVLLRSQLLQGHALEALLNLFEALSEYSTIGYRNLLDGVLKVVSDSSAKQVVNSIAQVVATLCTNASAANREATIKEFSDDLSSKDEQKVILALTCLGEIGRQLDLSSLQDLISRMRSHFDSSSEEIKSVASSALGRVSAGNPQLYVPQILADITSNQQQRYLMLRCLKELITVSATTPNSPLVPFVSQVLPLLFEYSESPEEGIRNVVAECVGKLALMDPHVVLPQLKTHTSAGSNPWKRATIITALKYTITESKQEIDKYLAADLQQFLAPSLKKDEPVKIRRAAILLLTAATHNKPDLVRSQLRSYMTDLYTETPLDKSLIREVNLGPFKHKVDDGLELRKAAFECMDILLDNTSAASLLEFLNDYGTFITHVKLGLKDENQDIRMLAHLMVSKLTKIPNAAVPLLTAMDSIAELLTSTVTKKLKANSVQQEKDRHDDQIKSCLRAIETIAQNVKGALDTPKFSELYNKAIKADNELRGLLEKIQKEGEKSEDAA